jgi:hypothetical protein
MSINEPIDTSKVSMVSVTCATTSDTTFTVSMHPDLVDELDEGFSPMDGIVSIDEMFNELPLLHRALAPTRLRKRAGHKLKVYRGCYDWYRSLGFSYVQLGTTLHVLELWYNENRNLDDVDVILGTRQTEGYKPFDPMADVAATDDRPSE